MSNISTLIVLLNWNGSYDTLDCCKSLSNIPCISDGPVDVLIIDNNSNDSSLEVLQTGLSKQFGDANPCEVGKDYAELYNLAETVAYGKFLLFCSQENHGFARGCNLGAVYAANRGYENVLFLNNDTVVEPNFLSPLFASLIEYDAVIPQIRYHYDPNLIWNCGGEISKFGSRKYNYAKLNYNDVTFPATIFPVTFATGCCILFETRYFLEIGLFSERFFFGEEDIELSLRLANLGSKVVCNTDSIIYHKVGASIQGDPEKLLRKAYIHYLNRFVNMKRFLGIKWYFWLIPSSMKVFFNLLVINKIGLIRAVSILKSLMKDSFELEEVSKEKFEKTLAHGIK